MKAIIFGANGQDGYYLNELLAKNHVDVIGVSRSNNIWLNGDIGDFNFVQDLIKEHQPEYIFHFAAISTTQHKEIFENHTAITTGTLNILEAVKNYCPTSKVFLSGSAMQFKNEEAPINEETPFEASSFYSLARIQSVCAGRYYRSYFGIQVYIGYFFNHDSPFRTENHVNKKITSAANRIKNGSNEKLELGNIDVHKEFNFAGDIMNVVWQMVNQNEIFEAVLGSGKSYTIRQWTEECFLRINKNWKDYVVVSQHFIPDYKILVSDPTLIKSIGWEPTVDFYQLVDLMMSNE